MNEEEIKKIIRENGFPLFRAKQISGWLQKGIESFEEMSNVPVDIKDKLSDKYEIFTVTIEKKYSSKLDDTIKYLLKLHDGEYVESVLMHYHHGYSICLSTQVGCNMGCEFCASTVGGKVRDLTAGEILGQIYAVSKDKEIRVSNIVLMGMGEPLDNYENVIKFLELVSCENGLNVGMRHISLSTCGLADKINQLAEKKQQLTLSVSLHAPNDNIRNEFMPINKKWNIDLLLNACKNYINKTGRRISFEYALIHGVNDSSECAEELANLLKGMLCHVNLIPVNQIHENEFLKPDLKQVKRFCDNLINRGINTTVRRTLGSDIDASCGQLRRQNL